MIPAEHAHLNIAAATHPGVKGKPNEDRYAISAYLLSSDDHTPSVLAVIADGIGGHRAGEVAAEMAVMTINQYLAENSPSQPEQILKQAFIHTSRIIFNKSRKDPSLTGMGTTCVCAWVIGDRLFAASMGDSRLYLQRGAKIIRLTTDHTWIQEALTLGTLKPDQTRGHPNAHIIRRFLGSMNVIDPDMRLRLSPAESDAQAEANQGLRLYPGDRLMLCSDGLTDLVKDTEILDILRTRQLDFSPTQLINLANQRGGHDNITVVTLEVPQRADITRPHLINRSQKTVPDTPIPHSSTSWLMIILLLVAIFLMLLLLIYTFVR